MKELGHEKEGGCRKYESSWISFLLWQRAFLKIGIPFKFLSNN